MYVTSMDTLYVFRGVFCRVGLEGGLLGNRHGLWMWSRSGAAQQALLPGPARGLLGRCLICQGQRCRQWELTALWQRKKGGLGHPCLYLCASVLGNATSV